MHRGGRHVAVLVSHAPRRSLRTHGGRLRAKHGSGGAAASRPDRAPRSAARLHGDPPASLEERLARRRGIDGVLRRAEGAAAPAPARRRAGRAAQYAAQSAAGPGQQHAGNRAVEALAPDLRGRRPRRALRDCGAGRGGVGDPHYARLCAVRPRLRRLSRRLGLPLFGGADADLAQLPGESGRARLDPQVLRRARRRIPRGAAGAPAG